MKDYKWWSIIKYLLGGFIAGVVVGFTKEGVLEYIGEMDIDSMLQSITPYVFILATILCSIGCGGYLYFDKLLKKDGYSEEEDSLYEKNEKKINVVMGLSTVGGILNFIAYGLYLGSTTEKSIEFVLILFVINCVLVFIATIYYLVLIKKIRPEFNPDPLAKDFEQEYFNKLDEREQFQVGKSSFKTLNTMMVSYIVVLILCYAMIILLEITPAICLPVGVLCMTQIILQVHYSNKEL